MWEIFFGWGSQGTEGVPVNHRLLNQKFADKHQLFYKL